jgi:hypothetical protein
MPDAGGPAAIRHPSELRAIPKNAILQQLGWCANTVHRWARRRRHGAPAGPASSVSYAAEHVRVLEPMARLFAAARDHSGPCA